MTAADRPPGFANVWAGKQFRQLMGATFGKLGLPVTARNSGTDDAEPGDFTGLEEFVLLVTAASSSATATCLDEAEGRARATGRRYGVVVHRRRGAAPEGHYVTMSAATFAQLVQDLNK